MGHEESVIWSDLVYSPKSQQRGAPSFLPPFLQLLIRSIAKIITPALAGSVILLTVFCVLRTKLDCPRVLQSLSNLRNGAFLMRFFTIACRRRSGLLHCFSGFRAGVALHPEL
jgi:hypothetical protein